MGQINIGIDNVARKVKGVYIGIDGIARKIKTVYVGVNNVAKLVWQSVIQKITQFISSLNNGSSSYSNGYIGSTSYGTLHHNFTNAQKVGNNLYATTYSENYYGDTTEHVEDGIMFVETDDNGSVINNLDVSAYSLTSSNTSPYGGSVNKYISFDDGKIFALCYEYISYTEYTEYRYKTLVYDYRSREYYLSGGSTEISTSTRTYYDGIASVANKGIVYLEEYYNVNTSTTSFYLILYLNITLGKSSTGSNTLNYEYGSATITKAFTSSSMFMCQLDDHSGIIVEYEYNTGNYRFLKYNVDTSSDSTLTGGDRITLTDLGTYSLNNNNFRRLLYVDENNLLLCGYSGCDTVVVTINKDGSIQLGSIVTLDGVTFYNDDYCKIGNSNTFACNFNFDTVNLVYVDTDKKVASLLGTASVGAKNHSVNYVRGTTCPFGDDSTISFPMNINYNTRTGIINSIINKFK